MKVRVITIGVPARMNEQLTDQVLIERVQ
ncbi:RNA polymerase sigma factor RpoE, partial [Vibrio splendidus]